MPLTLTRILALAFLTFATDASGVVERVLTTGNGTWTDEVWTNGLIWTGRVAPMHGEQATLRLGADGGERTIRLDADLTNGFFQVLHAAGNGTSVTFDANGHDVAPPTLDAASGLSYAADRNVFSVQPLHGSNYGKYFTIQNVDSRTAPYRMANPRYRFAVRDGCAELTFLRGTYNLYDPDGEGATARVAYFFTDSSTIPTTVRLEAGTVWRVGAIDVRGNGVSNHLAIAAAVMRVYGSWQDLYSGNANAQQNVFELMDKGEVTIDGTLKYEPFATSYAASRLFSISGGARLVTNGEVTFATPRTTLRIDGATWDASGNPYTWTPFDLFASSSATGSRVAFTNATLMLNKAGARMGSEASEESPLPVSLVASRLVTTSASISFRHADVVAEGTCIASVAPAGATLNVQSGTSVLLKKDSVVSNMTVCCGTAGNLVESGSTIVFEGGRHLLNRLEIGKSGASGSGTSIVRLLNGTVETVGNGSLCADIGLAAPGALEMMGGCLKAVHVNGGIEGTKTDGVTACLTGDGGTIVCAGTDARAWIHAFDVAEVGARGLTLDTNGHDPIVRQDFANADGVCGTLVKAGNGTLNLSVTDTCVTTTRVTTGTLALSPASASAFRTHLVITNGASFSLADGKATALTLPSLDISDGTLLLDADDVIAVDGTAHLSRLAIRLQQTPETGHTLDFLTVRETLDESSQAAVRTAICENDLPKGTHARFGTVHDETTGGWTVRLEILPDVEPLTAETKWIGPSWESPSSWTSGVPTPETVAVFPSGAIAEVPTGATVGAMRFCGDVSLSGAALEIGAEQGAAALTVEAGTVEIACPLILGMGRVPITVAAGATLAVSGALTGGDLVKTGDGAFSLTGENHLRKVVSLAGGRNALGSLSAVSGARSLALGGGTLESKSMLSLPQTTVAPVTADRPQIVKTDADTAMGPLDVTGLFLKRGAGKLTIDYSRETASHILTTVKTEGKTDEGAALGLPQDPDGAYSFPADGSAPVDGFAGLTVAEGELVLKGDPGKSAAQMVNGSLLVGMRTPEGASQPCLTLDGIRVRHHGHGRVWIGLGAGRADTFVRSPTLRLLNGAYLIAESTSLGYGSRVGDDFEPTLALTNSTIQALSQLIWSASRDLSHPARVRARDSVLLGDGVALYVGGAIDADIDRSTVAKSASACGEFYVQPWGLDAIGGQIVLRNGSRFRISRLSVTKLAKELSLVFDDSEWDWGGDDFTLSFPETLDANLFRVTMRGRGLRVAPTDGHVLTLAHPLVGDGGLRVFGEGTVAFGAGAYRFSGASCVETGVLDLSSAGKVSGGAFGGGNGIIRGGLLERTTVALETDEAGAATNGVPHFSDCTFTGSVKVDFGRAEDSALVSLPRDVLVARYSGTTKPRTGAWRLRGTGLRHVRGIFRARDGEVRMDAVPCGTVFIVR